MLRRLRARGGTGGFHGSAGWPGNNSLAFFTRSTGWRILFQLVFCVQVHVQPSESQLAANAGPLARPPAARPYPLRTAGNPVGEVTHANDTEETPPRTSTLRAGQCLGYRARRDLASGACSSRVVTLGLFLFPR